MQRHNIYLLAGSKKICVRLTVYVDKLIVLADKALFLMQRYYLRVSLKHINPNSDLPLTLLPRQRCELHRENSILSRKKCSFQIPKRTSNIAVIDCIAYSKIEKKY